MEALMALVDYYITGGLKILETGMIFVLVAFIGWNVKLYIEKPKEGELLQEPADE